MQVIPVIQQRPLVPTNEASNIRLVYRAHRLGHLAACPSRLLEP